MVTQTLSIVPISIVSACFSLQILLNSLYITARDFVSLECIQCLRIQKIVIEVLLVTKPVLASATAMNMNED